MAIAVHMIFEPIEGKTEELETVLHDVVGDVMGMKTSLGCDVLRSVDEPVHFTVIERWHSIADHIKVHEDHEYSDDIVSRLLPLLKGGKPKSIDYHEWVKRALKD